MIKNSCLEVSIIYNLLEIWETYLIELNNVWVTNLFKNIDFSRDPFYITFILNLVLFEYLNSYLFSSNSVSAHSDFSKSALAKWSTY